MMNSHRFRDDDLKGFKILGKPTTQHTNLVYHVEAPDNRRWYLKVFLDLLHPNLRIYDGAYREVLASRLAGIVNISIPEAYLVGRQGGFAVISRDVGEPLRLDPLNANSAPPLQERELRDLVEILVFSHWIRDYERSDGHLVRGGGRIWGIATNAAVRGPRPMVIR
jgi:hypothetical protein